ncbi:hypothetical protein ACJIZ3_024694 [Penstemon smallii]|uniref:Uncharacterized protein n=1 Tax=Penstemon smallii TaxID=265156 RepID=A0ABD3TV43_9LAMI
MVGWRFVDWGWCWWRLVIVIRWWWWWGLVLVYWRWRGFVVEEMHKHHLHWMLKGSKGPLLPLIEWQ